MKLKSYIIYTLYTYLSKGFFQLSFFGCCTIPIVAVAAIRSTIIAITGTAIVLVSIPNATTIVIVIVVIATTVAVGIAIAITITIVVMALYSNDFVYQFPLLLVVLPLFVSPLFFFGR